MIIGGVMILTIKEIDDRIRDLRDLRQALRTGPKCKRHERRKGACSRCHEIHCPSCKTICPCSLT
jgi:hypothetical protein